VDKLSSKSGMVSKVVSDKQVATLRAQLAGEADGHKRLLGAA
jgi:hypothetical protein